MADSINTRFQKAQIVKLLWCKWGWTFMCVKLKDLSHIHFNLREVEVQISLCDFHRVINMTSDCASLKVYCEYRSMAEFKMVTVQWRRE